MPKNSLCMLKYTFSAQIDILQLCLSLLLLLVLNLKVSQRWELGVYSDHFMAFIEHWARYKPCIYATCMPFYSPRNMFDLSKAPLSILDLRFSFKVFSVIFIFLNFYCHLRYMSLCKKYFQKNVFRKNGICTKITLI